MDEATERMLEDRGAVQDVLARYFQAVDRRDRERLSRVFTENASWRSVGAWSFTGADAIADGILKVVSRYKTTFHLMGNVSIEVHGDTATAESYTIAYHIHDRNAAKAWVVGLVYKDDLVREDDLWKISRRDLEAKWLQGEPKRRSD
jgi:ketosteroid isomerase-like protein